jgi:CheY-like chemotaxis protein
VALILVVSADKSFVEGISQTLSGAGHLVLSVNDAAEAIALRGPRPLVALVNREELDEVSDAAIIPLAKGGALVTYTTTDDATPSVPFRLRRATLADLQLPLEKKRLLALVKFVEDRAYTSGRSTDNGDPLDQRPPR